MARILNNDEVADVLADCPPSITTISNSAAPSQTEFTSPDRDTQKMFWNSVWKLARQQYYWSPIRFFRAVWTFAKNIPTQFRVLCVLSRPEYSRLIAVNPRFPLKWMGLDYIARGLTISEQAECFMHHYHRLRNLIPAHVLAEVLHQEILLDEIREGNDRFTIKMAISRPYDNEGELSLNFEVNGRVVFVLSFTIVPGWVVRTHFKEVLLISRVQGVRGCYDEIQLATKAMSDSAPPAILFAALCGFAEAFGLVAMAGISATMKPERLIREGGAEHMQQAYDEFFSELGAIKGSANFYLSQLPPSEKPLKLIKRGHKTRTKIKRAFKREIALRVCRRLRIHAQVRS